MEALGPLMVQIAMGIGLAACAGLRAFLPLFVVSLAGAMDWIPLEQRFGWLGTWPAVTVFGAAVVTELIADKVPWLDNVLDAGQTWVKPIAGAVLAVAVLAEMAPLEATVLGIMAGAPTAGLVHLTKAKLRLLSSVFTGGFANPVLSVAEDGLALSGAVLAIVVPVALVVVLLLTLLAIWIGLRRYRARAVLEVDPAGPAK